MMTLLGALTIAALSFGTVVVQDDVVMRRGSEPTLIGKITRIDESGIAVRSASGAEHSVTWDRVRGISTEDPSIQRSIDLHRDAAERLWRARLRLERGDTALAEPLFERLFAEYRGRTHETALIVAEGLLRCRLSRAAHDTALIPALEVSRLRRKGIRSSAYEAMPVLFDEATSLCTKLPPAWAAGAGLARVESDLKTYDAGGDTAVAAIASLYRMAARQHLNLPAESVPSIAADHEGVMLLRQLASCTDEDAAVRATARSALEKNLADLPGWAQAWARYAIGQSLLREPGEGGGGRREAALVNLAYLPATFQRDQPYLAGLALATICTQLQRMGATEEAAMLRAELIRLYPNHPALSMLDASAVSLSPASSDAFDARASSDSSTPLLMFSRAFDPVKEPA